MGSALWEGIIAGAATSTDDALKAHLKKQEDRLDARMTYLLQDAVSKRDVHRKDKREAEKALKAMYGLTGNWNDAALAIQTLGGVSKGGLNITTFIQNVRDAQMRDPNVKVAEVLKYTGEQDGNMTSTQALDNMVTPYSYEFPAIDPKQAEGIGERGVWSLFGKKNRDQQIVEEMRARGIPITRAGAKTAAQAIVNRAGGDVRNVRINYGALGAKEQQAARLQKVQIGGAEAQLKLTQDKVNNLDKANNRIIEAHQVAMQDKRSSMEDRSARLRVFNQEHTPYMVKLNRRLTIAKTIKAESGTDAEMQWNLLDTQERDYRQQIREAVADAGGGPTGRNVQNWREQIADIGQSKKALMPTIAASGTSGWAKQNAGKMYNDEVKHFMNIHPGIKFETNLAGAITNITEGKGPLIVGVYRQAYNSIVKTFGDRGIPAMDRQISMAYSKIIAAEENAYREFRGQKPYQQAMQTLRANKSLPKLFNPDGSRNKKIKEGQLVDINNADIVESRVTAGYMIPKDQGNADKLDHTRYGIWTRTGLYGLRR